MNSLKEWYENESDEAFVGSICPVKMCEKEATMKHVCYRDIDWSVVECEVCEDHVGEILVVCVDRDDNVAMISFNEVLFRLYDILTGVVVS